MSHARPLGHPASGAPPGADKQRLSHSVHKSRGHHVRSSSHSAPAKEPVVVENKLKRPTQFMCKIRFNNNLPEPASQLKLLTTHQDPDRYTKYTISSLEKKHKFKLQVEPDLGIPLDLLDVSVYDIPATAPQLEEKDQKLLAGARAAGRVSLLGGGEGAGGGRPGSAVIKIKERPADLGFNWLVKTQYVTPVAYSEAKQMMSEKDAKEKREMALGLRSAMLENMGSREAQVRIVEESFAAAKRTPVHQTKPGLKPLEVLPLLPLVDRWNKNLVHIVFDIDPTEEAQEYQAMLREDRDKAQARAILKKYPDSSSKASEDEESYLAYMLPHPEQLDKGMNGEEDDEEVMEEEGVEYKWVREYHWDPRQDDGGRATYLFCFDEDQGDVRFVPLGTKVVLRKRKGRVGGTGRRGGGGGDDDEEPTGPQRPSKITLKKRRLTEVEEENRAKGRECFLEGEDWEEPQIRSPSPEPPPAAAAAGEGRGEGGEEEDEDERERRSGGERERADDDGDAEMRDEPEREVEDNDDFGGGGRARRRQGGRSALSESSEEEEGNAGYPRREERSDDED